MKIAEVVAVFPPYHGGTGYVCFHNAVELARRGHEVTVFTLDFKSRTYKDLNDNFKVVRLKTPFLYEGGGMTPQLYSKLASFDIIHLHYPFYGGAEYVYLSSLLRSRRYFLTYHMDVFGTTALKRLLIGMYEFFFVKKIIKRADRIGALTIEHLRSSKVSHFVDWGKVVEIPNGVDTEKFRPRNKNMQLIEKHSLKGKTVALFVGNLQPFKGVHLLIDAIAGIKEKELCLLIVGEGYGEKEYKRQVISKGLEDRVIFAGPQSPDGHLPDYYNLGDFLVLPSTHSEAFPLVVLESMASGKPAIVSSLPGPSQLIENGRDGLIAKVDDRDDLRDKIKYLASHRDICINMGNAGRQKVINKYRWSSISEKLEEIFYDIIREDL